MFSLLYGIIWREGRGVSSHCKIIFKIQKTIIVGVIVGSSSRDSCHEQFKNSEVMPLQSQYMFYLLLFVRNRELLGLILMYITLMQDIILIYIYP